MPHIILVIFALLFTACATNEPVIPVTPVTPTPPASVTETAPLVVTSELPSTEQITDIDDLQIVEESTIIGKYRLKKGAYTHGEIHQDMDEGYLVIEELDVNNYGYYYVTVIKDISPETHSGIFYEKGGKFVQKVIYNDENSEKSKIITLDNIEIKQEGETLKIMIDSNKKETTIWQKDDGVFQPSQLLLNSIKDAKREYYDFYKKKCLSHEIECAEHQFTQYE